MKNVLKIALVAVFSLFATAIYAQKFGRIDYNQILSNMPDMENIQKQLETAQNEYRDQLESLYVEYNNKANDMQKATAQSESVKQLKQREIQDMGIRIQEFEEVANEELQKLQSELVAPVIEKIDVAIKKVSKAENLVAVFQISQGVVYLDEAATVDVTPKVKNELGIKATPDAK